MNHKQTLAMLFSSVALLSGCGGDSDNPPPPPPPAASDAIPPSASATAAGLKNYLVTLGMDLPENKEALDLTSFAPPLDDNTEPEPVN